MVWTADAPRPSVGNASAFVKTVPYFWVRQRRSSVYRAETRLQTLEQRRHDLPPTVALVGAQYSHPTLATFARKVSDFLPVLLDAFPPTLRHSRVT